MNAPPAKSVIVIGAGAFGGWTALQLQRSGAQVTLVEVRDAGNELSSSGGESRVIRHVYGSPVYVELARRALQLWLEFDLGEKHRLLHQKGVLFMSQGNSQLEIAAENMQQAGVEFEWLDEFEVASRFPQINTEGITQAIYEQAGGYLCAKQACLAVRDAFIREGGKYVTGKAIPGLIKAGEMQGVALETGERLQAGRYIFACGPWLKSLFPDVFAGRLKITRQEVYFFTTPEHQSQALNRDLPVWAVWGDSLWYGIPGADGTFKLADDRKGSLVDPETQSRDVTESGVEAARRFMEFRFPGMKNAALKNFRVCQYSMTSNDHFVLDRHPQAANTWLLGGGSGHGFKHGPSFGELAAKCVLGDNLPASEFSLVR